MKKTRTKMKTKIKKKTIEEPKCQSDAVKEEEHGRQGRVKFWVGDFIDNESTPVETRQGDEVKIVSVIKSTGYVSGNILNDSYRELQTWNEDGVHLRNWYVDEDPRFDLFFSSTGKNTISTDIDLRPYMYDELVNIRLHTVNISVLEKNTENRFTIMHISHINSEDECTYDFRVVLSDKQWMMNTISGKELLEHYTWLNGKPCGRKRGRR